MEGGERVRRVEYDLNDSNYISEINDYIFYFSSSFNKRRFDENYLHFAVEEMAKLKAKYHVSIDLLDYLTIVFYKRIEKRGFRVLSYNDKGDLVELTSDFIYQ